MSLVTDLAAAVAQLTEDVARLHALGPVAGLIGYDKTASGATTTLAYGDGNYCRLTLAHDTVLALSGFPETGVWVVHICGVHDGTGFHTLTVPTSSGWYGEGGQPMIPLGPGERFRLQLIVDQDAGVVGLLPGVVGETEI